MSMKGILEKVKNIKNIKNIRKPMTNEQYYKKMEKARKVSKNRLRKQKIKETRNQGKRKFKFPTTTKVLLFTVVLICLEMIIFAQVMSWRTGDTMSIGSYLTIGGTLVTVGCSYMFKSLKENCNKYGGNNQGQDESSPALFDLNDQDITPGQG